MRYWLTDRNQVVFADDAVHVVSRVQKTNCKESIQLKQRSPLNFVDLLQDLVHLFTTVQPFERSHDEVVNGVLLRESSFSFELPHIDREVEFHPESVCIANPIKSSEEFDWPEPHLIAFLNEGDIESPLGLFTSRN
jgi:hypothetical protein